MGLFPVSHISLHLLFPDIAVGLQTRHPGLLSGLAVLSVFIIIIPSVILCLMYKRGQGRIFSEGKKWKGTFLLPGTEVIYPRWVGWKCPLFQGISLPNSPHRTTSPSPREMALGSV